MEQIILPTSIEFIDTNNSNIGKVVITPCHQGYGTTLGNALRRVLLSSLPGAAVESIKINGVQHEFSSLTGIKEDVVDIILNLKQLAVRSFSDEPVTLTLSKKGKGDILAGDIDKNSDVEIANPEMKIATLTDDKTKFEMEIVINKGRGYVPVESKNGKNLDLGTILIDSLYTPIRDIGYNVELTRVGDVTDFEKLVLNIETNGTITPREAVQQATKILMDHFALLLDVAGNEGETKADEKETEEISEVEVKETKEENPSAIAQGKEKKKTKKEKTEKSEKKATKKTK